jgi:cytoskeleton protein RodZ
MNQLGERLREARESQGISISQAAVETRILQRYLVALEDGDYQHLPGDVYARGFIRNYAEYLSLPAEELIELYRRERGMSEPIRVVPVTTSPRVRRLMIPSFFGVFFVVLVLVGASYLLLSTLNYVGQSAQTQVAFEPTSAPTPPPLPTSAPRPTDGAPLAIAPTAAAGDSAGGVGVNPTPATAATGTPGANDAPISGVVSIDPGTNPGSWLQIKQDGQTVLQKVLAPGQSFSFNAQRDLWIRAGNASVVTVEVKGQPPKRLGINPGEVVTFTWPPQ